VNDEFGGQERLWQIPYIQALSPIGKSFIADQDDADLLIVVAYKLVKKLAPNRSRDRYKNRT